jgi:hypothetical protein
LTWRWLLLLNAHFVFFVSPEIGCGSVVVL